jgi:hypothetical protein
MTTIRAHPPVETPAGLMVALPPCEICAELKALGFAERRCTRPPLKADVFALAVLCPMCEGDSDPRWPCPPKLNCQNGYVHHGDYRVLDVLPIVNEEHGDGLPDHLCRRDDGRVTLVRDGSFVTPFLDLPAAVPGGVALVVERVDP